MKSRRHGPFVMFNISTEVLMRPCHRRSQRTAAVLLGALLAVAGCRPPTSGAAPLSAQDVAAIKSTLATWKEASLAGDWPSFFGQFTEDAVWMGPKGASVEGLATIRQGTWFRALEEELVPVQIDGRGLQSRFRAVTARLGNSPAPELQRRRHGPARDGAHSANPPGSSVQVPGREGGEQCLIAD